MTSPSNEHQHEDTPMPAPHQQRPSMQQIANSAYGAARRTALDLARDLGTAASRRPIFHGSPVSRTDVEPLDGLRAARHVEMASQGIHPRRQGGRAHLDDIGRAVERELQYGSATAHINESVADTVYNYATGTDPETARYYRQSFGWTCPSCSNAIQDHGMSSGPADDEQGHAKHCPRLAAIEAWNAEWDDLEGRLGSRTVTQHETSGQMERRLAYSVREAGEATGL